MTLEVSTSSELFSDFWLSRSINWTESSSKQSATTAFLKTSSALSGSCTKHSKVDTSGKQKKIIHGEVEQKHENKHLQGNLRDLWKFCKMPCIIRRFLADSVLFSHYSKRGNLHCHERLAIALLQPPSSSSNAILMIYRVWRENMFSQLPESEKKKINLRNAFLSEFF